MDTEGRSSIRQITKQLGGPNLDLMYVYELE